MLHKFFQTILLLFCIVSQSCSQPNIQNLGAPQFMQQLASMKGEILLDVRTPDEYKQEHLANALNIDVQSDNFDAETAKLDKSKPVFVYCLSGGRSTDAAKRLNRKGFTQIYQLTGGILQWKANNYPLAGSDPAAQTWKGMTQEEFDKITKGPKPVLIDFKAAWCGPCKMLKPILDEIGKEYSSQLDIVEIDIDKNKSLADAMKIRNIPLLVYYKNGKVAMNIEGYADKSSIIKSLSLK